MDGPFDQPPQPGPQQPPQEQGQGIPWGQIMQAVKPLLPALIAGTGAALSSPIRSAPLIAGRAMLGGLEQYEKGEAARAAAEEAKQKDLYYSERLRHSQLESDKLSREMAAGKSFADGVDDPEAKAAALSGNFELAHKIIMGKKMAPLNRAYIAAAYHYPNEIIDEWDNDKVNKVSAELMQADWERSHPNTGAAAATAAASTTARIGAENTAAKQQADKIREKADAYEKSGDKAKAAELRTTADYVEWRLPIPKGGGSADRPTTNELAVKALRGDKEAARALAAAGGSDRFIKDLSRRASGFEVTDPEIAALSPESAKAGLTQLGKYDVLKGIVNQALAGGAGGAPVIVVPPQAAPAAAAPSAKAGSGSKGPIPMDVAQQLYDDVGRDPEKARAAARALGYIVE